MDHAFKSHRDDDGGEDVPCAICFVIRRDHPGLTRQQAIAYVADVLWNSGIGSRGGGSRGGGKNAAGVIVDGLVKAGALLVSEG